MPQYKKKFYMPLRNIVSSLLPLSIISWYLFAKLSASSILLRITLITVAFGLQLFAIYTSSRTRKERRSFFWDIYNFLTANGRLPLRLLANALVLILLFGIAFEISGLKRIGGVPDSFIVRFVEVDLYWSILNFLGISDNSLEAYGFSKFLTLLVAASGLLFWGMYISILVNKHLDLRSILRGDASPEEIEQIYYNESPDTSDT